MFVIDLTRISDYDSLCPGAAHIGL